MEYQKKSGASVRNRRNVVNANLGAGFVIKHEPVSRNLQIVRANFSYDESCAI